MSANARTTKTIWLLRGSLLGPLLVLFLALSLVPAAFSADSATLTYRRVFKGSTPEFIEIKVSEDGTASYDIRQSSEDATPQPFELAAQVQAKLFSLAGELHNFEGADLDVHRRVADLGQKTLRYEKGGQVHQTQFNYTTDHSATQLQTIFEGLAQQLEDRDLLQQRLKYDRLGVNDALTQLELHLNQRALPEPERLLPVLDSVASDAKLVEVARERARALAARIRASQQTP
jgi:hypothetical protein